MRSYRFLQLDVFTNRRFGGNQLAVFPEAMGLADDEMQAIAAEMNYSETTFVLPARDTKALCRVRIFTPGAELPFAGHPVIGTTFALAQEGKVRDGDPSPIHLELGIGTLPVDVLFEDRKLSFAWMHQPVPEFTKWPVLGRGAASDPKGAERPKWRERLASVLGLTVEDLVADLPIERGSAGVPFVYIPVRSTEALERARPAAGLGEALRDTSAHLGAYVFTLDGLPYGVTARSRMFPVGMGMQEDAATGAAAGPFGVYLLRHGRIHPDSDGEARARIEQGVEMGRPSTLDVAIERMDETVRDVRVGGEAVYVAEGSLWLPEGER